MTIKEYEQLIRTLNKIEVHGADNLDMLLACIKFLEQKQKESEEENG